jgi:hypothetical protein
MQGRDFQVLQTYDQVEDWAKRIAESVQSQLDGA